MLRGILRVGLRGQRLSGLIDELLRRVIVVVQTSVAGLLVGNSGSGLLVLVVVLVCG